MAENGIVMGHIVARGTIAISIHAIVSGKVFNICKLRNGPFFKFLSILGPVVTVSGCSSGTITNKDSEEVRIQSPGFDEGYGDDVSLHTKWTVGFIYFLPVK